jgi:putative transcription factor
MNHQDWNDVVFKKNTKSTYKHTELSKEVKIENDSDNLSNQVVGLSLGNQIQKTRIAKGIRTQKELAVMVNVKPEIINKYENGSAIPDSKVLQKLRKALGTRLKVT